VGAWNRVSRTSSFQGEVLYVEEFEGCETEDNFEFLEDNQVIYQHDSDCNSHSTSKGEYDPIKKTLTIFYTDGGVNVVHTVTQVNANEIDLTATYDINTTDPTVPTPITETLRCKRGQSIPL